MRIKRNVLFIMIGIFIIISIVFLFIKDNYIMLGFFTKVKINGDEIIVYDDNNDLSNINGKVLFNNEFIDCNIRKEDKNGINYYTYVNSNGDILSFSNNLVFSVTGNIDVKLGDYSFLDTINKTDTENLNYIKIENNIIGETNYYKKVEMDLDNDGNKETIYSVQLLDNEYNIYSFVYLYDGESISVISKTVGSLEKPIRDTEKLAYIADLNNDDIYEIITSKSTGDNLPTYANVYEYDNGEYIEIERKE